MNTSSLSQLTSLSEEIAEKKIDYLFNSSGIFLWLKSNRGGTYFRARLELSMAAQEMFFHQFMVESLENIKIDAEAKIQSLGEAAGKAKADLKPWEISYIDSWKFNLEGGKSTTKTRSFYLWFLGLSDYFIQNSLKTFLSFISVISLILMFTNTNNKQIDPSLKFVIILFSVFAGASMIHLLSISIYNWYYTQESNPKRYYGMTKFNALLLTIWISESLLGMEAVAYFRRSPSNPLEIQNYIAIFLGTSIFALTNIIFAVTKAKRDKITLASKKDLLSLIEQQRGLYNYISSLSQRINNCTEKAKNAKEKWDRLLEEECGISFQVYQLSRNSYIENPTRIPLTQEEIDSLTSNGNQPENGKKEPQNGKKKSQNHSSSSSQDNEKPPQDNLED